MIPDYRHFFDGGTMITNSKLDKFEQYQKAIELYKLENPSYVLHVEKRAFEKIASYETDNAYGVEKSEIELIKKASFDDLTGENNSDRLEIWKNAVAECDSVLGKSLIKMAEIKKTAKYYSPRLEFVNEEKLIEEMAKIASEQFNKLAEEHKLKNTKCDDCCNSNMNNQKDNIDNKDYKDNKNNTNNTNNTNLPNYFNSTPYKLSDSNEDSKQKLTPDEIRKLRLEKFK